MLKKVGIIAAVAAAFSVAVASTAWGSAKAPSAAALANASVTCTRSVTIGVAYPATGDAATIGAFQWDWARFAAAQWNKAHAMKITLQQGDTVLGPNDQAVPVAHSFASNGHILALTGPAGSQEVQDSIGIYKTAGLGAVSGSATRVRLTRATSGTGGGPRETTPGYFFRTVPNDGQQGDRVASWIHNNLHATHVYIIDDEESYSQGLALQVKGDLQKVGGITIGINHVSQSASDFSSLITSIPSNTQVVYIPWQLADKAQLFQQQLHSPRPNAIVFGSDGVDAPGTFQPNGHGYVSGFPVDFTNPVLTKFANAHGGHQETFGLPTYTSVMVNAFAIQKACNAGGGQTTRVAVRRMIPKVTLNRATSLLGFPVSFLTANSTTSKFEGAGDMGGAADFAIFQILGNGNYKRVG